MTNNEAEYEAIIAGLKLALKYGARRVVLKCNSQLVVNQVVGAFQIKEQRLQKYQDESSNKTILNILKKKLEEAKGLWPELLPEVLWAYRTTPKTSTGETLYSLVYGTDSMIPVEVREPSLRYSNESRPSNEKNWK
uniref:Uncharacterized protein LOC104247466 n=1 Tax=Nicotiana sylvestris TaxID=4096 RepID=A0A1U7YF74_NICSY|nr:PREDICTED: uncharacterized protein LOC104247466 [Nicotiana sylvestris]